MSHKSCVQYVRFRRRADSCKSAFDCDLVRYGLLCYSQDGGSRVFRNAGIQQPNYTASRAVEKVSSLLEWLDTRALFSLLSVVCSS